jgi:hypothetical protein
MADVTVLTTKNLKSGGADGECCKKYKQAIGHDSEPRRGGLIGKEKTHFNLKFLKDLGG